MKTMVKLIGRSYTLLQFFLYYSFSLYFALCVFLNLFPSLCFPYALSISALKFSLFSFCLCLFASLSTPLLLTFSLFWLSFSLLQCPLSVFSSLSRSFPSVFSSLSPLLSSPSFLNVVHPLAFIARGCRCFPFVVVEME
ncbi:hypothetical protein NC651_002278 [Populus alba x Populus x berolinensis]|nr:hypothetical protein NC651_002278 [Populus alba x Populus x berolinensis]